MNDPKSTISQARSYQEIGEHWDEHDMGEVWESTEPVEFSLSPQSTSSTSLYAVESSLSQRLHALAHKRGVSAETLVNLWLQEKVAQEAA